MTGWEGFFGTLALWFLMGACIWCGYQIGFSRAALMAWQSHRVTENQDKKIEI